jgi:murein L,D-transpeptidase YcbB/YkuD
MERWRWLPRRLPDRYIMANIPRYSLRVSDNGADTLEMKIIVGNLHQPTPVFTSRISYLVLNPWWEVPYSIAAREILPEVKKDIGYLSRNHLKAYKASGNGWTEIQPELVQWASLTADRFDLRLRQTPGPWNALGTVKFIFPNKYSIYFHDTPRPELFGETERTFSHGCIRIEKPLAMASYLLQKDTLWVKNKQLPGTTIVLNTAVTPDVFICYWTVWTDENGITCYAPDVYGYDRVMEKLLALKASREGSEAATGIIQ